MTHPLVTLDESTHTYRLADGQTVPGVSEILRRVGISELPPISPERLEAARERGSAIHAACELIDEGTIDWSTIDPVIAGNVAAFAEFRARIRPVTVAREAIVYSRKWGFAGRLDWVGYLIVVGRDLAIADYKSGTPSAWTELQLALYRLAWNEEHTDQRAGSLYRLDLPASGRPRLVSCDRPGLSHDAEVVLAFFRILNRYRKDA
jgi:hypothetical protein